MSPPYPNEPVRLCMICCEKHDRAARRNPGGRPNRVRPVRAAAPGSTASQNPPCARNASTRTSATRKARTACTYMVVSAFPPIGTASRNVALSDRWYVQHARGLPCRRSARRGVPCWHGRIFAMRSIRAPASPYWANSVRAAARISPRSSVVFLTGKSYTDELVRSYGVTSARTWHQPE